MTLRRFPIAAAAVAPLVLAACEAPPQEAPAAPPAEASPAAQPEPPPEPAPAADRGMVEPPFVGRWAAEAAWCANETGAERPIRITASRFEGYENRCDIRSVVRNPEGWDATLACEAEGQRTTERVRMQVRGDEMVVTYRDRDATAVTFVRCREPATTDESAPAR